MRNLEGGGKKFRNQIIRNSLERGERELLKDRKIEKNREDLAKICYESGWKGGKM